MLPSDKYCCIKPEENEMFTVIADLFDALSHFKTTSP